MENEMEQNGVTEEELIPSADETEEILPAEEQAEDIKPPADEEEAVISAAQEPEKAKKKGTFKIVLISVIATVLVLVLALGLAGGVLVGAGLINFDDWFGGSDDGSYAVSEKDAPKMAKKVVGKIEDVKLTNGELQVYYNANLINLQSNYGYYLLYYYGIDLNQPLDTLIYDEATGQTWQELILENAVNNWHEITAMNMQAKEDGFQLNAEQQEYLTSMDTQLQQMAIDAGFETVEEIIHAQVGISATEEGFRNFMKEEYFYSCYYASLVEKLAPTQEQIDTYFAENEQALAAQGVTKETCTVDVRHILIQPEGGTPGENNTTVYTDEAWEACLQKAQQILDTWKAGEATEESFAELAKEHSADGNASQGGLYTDVTEGYMVETFNDWIFDTAREKGNVDIVKTQFGYHIMFFVGREYTWSAHCANALLTDSLQYAVDSAKEKYPMEINYDRIVLS